MRSTKKFSIASLACLPLFACGGDSGNKTVKLVDAKVFLDGSAAVACKAGSAYTAPGPTQRGTDRPGMGSGSAHLHEQIYRGDINGDLFVMFMTAGSGPWAGDLMPTAVDLAALNTLNPQVQLIPMPMFGSDGFLTDDSFYNGSYLGFAGTINFTSIGGSGMGSGGSNLLAGSFTNVELDHVLINSSTGAITDPMDGCKTILNGTFSAKLALGSAAFQGADDNGIGNFTQPVLTNRRF